MSARIESAARTARAFLTLHPFNLAAALIYRLWGPVAYWRTESLPSFILRFFEPLQPHAHFTSVQWNELIELAHDNLKQKLTSCRPELPALIECGDKTFDLRAPWLDSFAHAHEFEYLGLHLVHAWSVHRARKRCRVVKSGTRQLLKKLTLPAPSHQGIVLIPGSVVADRAWALARSIAKTCRTIARLLLVWSSGDARPARCLVLGIAPQEIARGPRQLDCTFLVASDLISPDELLFLLPAMPDGEQQRWLGNRRVRWSEERTILGSLTLHARLRALRTLASCATRILWRRTPGASLVISMCADGLPWFELARQRGVSLAIVGLGGGVQDHQSIPFIRAVGVRTIAWQHALVGFSVGTSKAPVLANGAGEQAALGADEFCVWTPADRQVLERRSLLAPADQPNLHITGPVMSGHSAFAKLPRFEARAMLALPADRLIVSVFDLPTHVPERLRQTRMGMSRLSKEFQSAFFEHLIGVLDAFPQLALAIKPKRDFGRHVLVLTDPYRELLDPAGRWRAEGRVFVLPADLDPYLPIAIADACLGMPFTSPIAAALHFRRAAAWYDPVGYCEQISPPEIGRALVKGKHALRQRMTDWVNGAYEQEVPSSLLSGVNDPLEAFAEVVAQRSMPETSTALRAIV